MLKGNETAQPVNAETFNFLETVHSNQKVINIYKKPGRLLTQDEMNLIFSRFLLSTQTKPVNIPLDDFYRRFSNTLDFITILRQTK